MNKAEKAWQTRKGKPDFDHRIYDLLKMSRAKDAQNHACKALMDMNRLRQLNGESQVFIFQDFDNCKFLMKVGLEFIEVGFCPYCGEKLC